MLRCELIVPVSPAWNACQRSPPNDAASKYGSCPRIDACSRTGPGTSASGTTRWPSNYTNTSINWLTGVGIILFFIGINSSGSSMNLCVYCDCLHFTCSLVKWAWLNHEFLPSSHPNTHLRCVRAWLADFWMNCSIHWVYHFLIIKSFSLNVFQICQWPLGGIRALVIVSTFTWEMQSMQLVQALMFFLLLLLSHLDKCLRSVAAVWRGLGKNNKVASNVEHFSVFWVRNSFCWKEKVAIGKCIQCDLKVLPKWLCFFFHRGSGEGIELNHQRLLKSLSETLTVT